MDKRITALRHLYHTHFGQMSSFFSSRTTPWSIFSFCVDTEEVTPPYEKITSLQDITPPESLISMELETIASSICGYQTIRANRYFASGDSKDAVNVVLEEFKQWLHQFTVSQQLPVSITEIEKRIQYVRALRVSGLFSSRRWTHQDDETMTKVLYKTERELDIAKKKLVAEMNVNQVTQTLDTLKIRLGTLLTQLTLYLTFVLRTGPLLTPDSGQVKSLQQDDTRVNAVTQTVSGKLLQEVLKTPLLLHVFHAELIPNTPVNSPRASSDNPLITYTQGCCVLKENIINKITTKNTSMPSGIESVFLTATHKAVLKHFLQLHGLLYELARFQGLVHAASALVAEGGRVALTYFQEAAQVMLAGYRFLDGQLDKSLASIEYGVTVVSDDNEIRGRRLTSDAWPQHRHVAQTARERFMQKKRSVMIELQTLTELSSDETLHQRSEHIASIANSFLAQSHLLKTRYGLTLTDEKTAVNERTLPSPQKSVREEKELLFPVCATPSPRHLPFPVASPVPAHSSHTDRFIIVPSQPAPVSLPEDEKDSVELDAFPSRYSF